MQIVGIDETDGDGVDTIDVWFSERRQRWVVERLDAMGRQFGPAHVCDTAHEAQACLVEWLRTHQETRLMAPHDVSLAERIVLSSARRQAA